MLYFIHGNANKVFEKSSMMTKTLLLKKPNAALFKVGVDNFSNDLMDELLGGAGLFENKYIVTASRILESDDAKTYFLNNLQNLEKSENIFFWAEEDVDKKSLEEIKKYATKVMFFEKDKKETEKKKMNIFDLADALGDKDKKKTWILYQKAMKEFSSEEIYGPLWWKLKTILIAQNTKTAEEGGMKAFPYQKAKKCLTNFSQKDLQNTARNFIKIYHQSRLDGESLELKLEKFLLEF